MFPKLITGIADAKRILSLLDPLEMTALPDNVAKKTSEALGASLSPSESVAKILEDVKTLGDDAIRHYTKMFDGIDLKNIEVSNNNIENANTNVPADISKAIDIAITRVTQFHKNSLPKRWMNNTDGTGEMYKPIERVGIYVPSGLSSSVVMSAVPAIVAGVKEVILATPPGENGIPSDVVLAAAKRSGVHKVFSIGGATAIAALAFGTKTVPDVDKVCGGGNIFVTLAKKQVFGKVDIDGLYGPTETVVVADEFANPIFCAADLLAQAEHDALATPILVSTSAPLIEQVQKEVMIQLEQIGSKNTAKESLDKRGMAVLVQTLDEAIELANFIAPEHLCLLVNEPSIWLEKVSNAGGVFLGEYSPEVMGDYVAGPSHIMPTGGTARFNSYLGVHQFLKPVPIVKLNRTDFLELGIAAATIARGEGLSGHAAAVDKRLDALGDKS